MFAQSLAYVAIVSRDPDAAAARLTGLFGLPPSWHDAAGGAVPVLAIGRSAIVVLPPGHPLAEGRTRPGVDHIGIGVDEPQAAAAEAERRGIRRAGAPATGIAGAPVVRLAPEDLGGVRAVLARPLPLPPAGQAAVTRIDHLGIASADAFGAIGIYRDRLGLPLESTQTDVESVVAIETFTSDRYGVVHHSRPARIVGGLRVAFLSIGDSDLEFLQNLDAEHTAEVDARQSGTTKQDQGAIARYVARHGPGLHHIALKTDDIDGLLAQAGAAGVPVIDHRGRPGSRRGLIGFFHPDAFGGVLVHLLQRAGA